MHLLVLGRSWRVEGGGVEEGGWAVRDLRGYRAAGICIEEIYILEP